MIYSEALHANDLKDTDMKIQYLQAKALVLLKIESKQQLTERQRAELVKLSDQLYALGSRLPDNVGAPLTIVQSFVVLRLDTMPPTPPK